MKKRFLVIGISIMALFFYATPIEAQIAASIDGVQGDSRLAGHINWIDFKDIQLDVAHDNVASGKSGIQDINIGLGNLSEIVLSKTFDIASLPFIQYGIAGNTTNKVTIHLLKAGGGNSYTYLEIVLERASINTYDLKVNNEGTSTEKVGLKYNKIGFKYFDAYGREIKKFGWDLAANRTWYTF